MKLIKKYKYLITILLFAALLIYLVFIKLSLNQDKEPQEDIVQNIILKDNIEEENISQYYIDIKGAIKNPGVYLVDSNYTVNEKTTTNMIQNIRRIFAINPLISKGI